MYREEFGQLRREKLSKQQLKESQEVYSRNAMDVLLWIKCCTVFTNCIIYQFDYLRLYRVYFISMQTIFALRFVILFYSIIYLFYNHGYDDEVIYL